MKLALYVGTHARDALAVRLGWRATRLVQKGDFSSVTHTEAIHQENSDGTVTIASSSLRDRGVRTKGNVWLDPSSWRIAEVAAWSLECSQLWFLNHRGEPYDWRGAWATVMPGHHQKGRWFCNEADGASVGLATPHCFHPAQFAAICFTFGREITEEFFGERGGLTQQ